MEEGEEERGGGGEGDAGKGEDSCSILYCLHHPQYLLAFLSASYFQVCLLFERRHFSSFVFLSFFPSPSFFFFWFIYFILFYLIRLDFFFRNNY